MASSSTTTNTITNNNQSYSFLNSILNKFYSVEPDPVEEVRKTLLKLSEKYGSTHPSFRQGSFNEAASHAKSKFKLLLVYIHSQKHQSSNQFCRDVLFTREFKEFIDSNFIIWACDINTTIGFQMFEKLNATTFPYLAVICCNNIQGLSNGPQSKVVDFYGSLLTINRTEIINNIREIQNIYEPSLVVAKTDQEQREQDRFIIQEQDQAYLDSLAQDQEKDRLEKERLEQEQLEKEREEREEQEKLQHEQDLQNRKQKKLELFTHEPIKSELTSRILIKLSDGSRIQRNFLRTDNIQHILDFVDTQINEPVENFNLMNSFPKKFLSNLQSTILEEGLYPDTTLLLTDKL